MGGESLTTEDVGSAWLHVVASAPLYVVGGGWWKSIGLHANLIEGERRGIDRIGDDRMGSPSSF